MSRITLLAILMFCYIISSGQNISVTFTGTGAVTQIDSVTATNQRTKQNITFPGNETLVLTVNTGISSVSELTNMGIAFPNPFSGRATVTTIVQRPQTVYLTVRNLVGEVIAETQAFVQPGENLFDVSLATAGIYMVTLTTEEAKSSFKIICTGATTAKNGIQYLGAGSNNYNSQYNQNNQNSTSFSALKSLNSGYSLGFTSGDRILYRCRSGVYTSILTDSPAASKNYPIVFVACTDPDGKNYSIVKIGTQTWMIENLAYLPRVSPSSIGSDGSALYYVYGYEGTSVSAAKGTANYTTYGVLYNWAAARFACPSGWHLPSDEEWKILEKNLGMSESDADASGWRNSGTVGGKLKESGNTHWSSPNTGANNTSGFTALPGGYPGLYGGFGGLGTNADFWSSSDSWPLAWGRSLDYDRYGVARYLFDLGSGKSVRCLLVQVDGLATISTTEITALKETSAFSGGNVTSDGGYAVTSKGVCWNTTGTPTTDDNKTIDGTGTGVFTSFISGLTDGTTYYVRAYATNSVGTAYGVVKPFTTTGGTFTDSRDGHNYTYKTIGTQTWMAENLAYLPSVNPYSASSNTTPYNYVYGYNGTTVSAAKATANYTTYGVLYNWPAAMNRAASSTSVPSGVQGICPAGWHLPSDAEWTVLTDFLTNNGYGYGGSGSDIGKSMAATSGWNSYSTAGTIGNNQATNNSSGFTALPGGFRSDDLDFYSLGYTAAFGSSSGSDASYAWSRVLDYNYDGLTFGYSASSSALSVRCIRN